MSLYASLGFDAKEPLALMRGSVAAPNNGRSTSGAVARFMTAADLPACGELCRRVHGIDRTGELRDALVHFRPFVLERGGAVAAYASAPTFWIMNHGVAETPQDLRDLIAGVSAQGEGPLSLLVPIRDAELFRWCLARGLRVVKPMTLMTMGSYIEPRGAWYPSVEY
jgi:hypothetical protein